MGGLAALRLKSSVSGHENGDTPGEVDFAGAWVRARSVPFFLRLGGNAMLIEGFGQHLGNRSRIGAFNLETVQREHRLAIAKNGHGWRRRWNARQQLAYPRHGVYIRSCENSRGRIGPIRMIQCQTDGRPRFSRRAAAHGIGNHQNSSAAGGQQPVHLFGCSGFLYPVLREVLTHRDDQLFWITHILNIKLHRGRS